MKELSPDVCFPGKIWCKICVFPECDLNRYTCIGYLAGFFFQFVFLSVFYPRDAMLARVFATATCPSVRLSHAGIVPSRAKAGS